VRNPRLLVVLACLQIVLLPCGLIAQQEAAPRAIDPEAEVVLRQWSQHHRQIESAVICVADTIDDVEADGRKIQYAHTREFTIVRPRKLRMVMTGDVTNRTLWKDGALLTVLDRDANVYAQVPDPGTIDQAVTLLQKDYGMGLPAADLLVEDIGKTMIEGCESIDYIGLGLVGDEQCHHLAFTRGIVDWQVWIGAGDVPSLRKMVITYKELPGKPQYTMHILSVGDPGKVDDATFTAVIPEGAERIQFYPETDSQ